MSAAGRPRAGRWRRRGLAAALAVLVLAVAGAAVFSWLYPGLTAGLVHQARYSTLYESRNMWDYVTYLTFFLEKLTYDRDTGTYNFKHTTAAGLDLYEQGRLLYHQGQFAAAAAKLEQHIKDRGESKNALFWLALSYMRDAEAANCLAALADPAHHQHAMDDTASYCSLPLRRTHARQDPSRQAVRVLTRLLDRYGADDADSLLYRWLLNWSYMTVGGYPAEVPARYRVETPFVDLYYGAEGARRQRLHADLKFVDRARELGVENFGTGRGIAVEDFDGDGFLDLVTTGSYGGVKLYHNEGGKRFTDWTAGSGLEGIRQPMSISVADYDNDGLMDIFVVCPYSHFHLFKNLGGGKFRDVTESSGLLAAIPPGSIATSWLTAWGDVNNDGFLDLFVAGWAFQIPFLSGLPATHRIDSKLFINERGHFRDATAEYGLAGDFHDRHLIGAAFGDYDGDGWIDLLVTGPMPGTTALYHNVGGKRFERSPALDWQEPGFTVAFLDVNHDGRLDIFQGGFADARTAVTQAVFGRRRGELKSGHNVIFLQRPDGHFEPHPEFFEDGGSLGSMGASFGDLDNDGCLDFYIGKGDPEPWFVLPSQMYLGREEPDGSCSGRMENISMLDGFGTMQKGHGIVFFDFDNDGRQDVFFEPGRNVACRPLVFSNVGQPGADAQLLGEDQAARAAQQPFRRRLAARGGGTPGRRHAAGANLSDGRQDRLRQRADAGAHRSRARGGDRRRRGALAGVGVRRDLPGAAARAQRPRRGRLSRPREPGRRQDRRRRGGPRRRPGPFLILVAYSVFGWHSLLSF